MAGGWSDPFRQLAVTSKWRQRFLDSKVGLGQLFKGSVTDWTFAQRQMSSWLRYYDGFYERVGSQGLIVDDDVVTAAMAIADVVVDSFLVWYEWKYDQQRKERKAEGSGVGSEPRMPRSSEHDKVYRGAHF